MNNIDKLWQEFKRNPFPSNISGIQIEDIDPIDVNTIAASCINSFLDSGERLDPKNKEKLNRCMSELRALNPTLVGDAQVYFGKLYRLCDLVYEKL